MRNMEKICRFCLKVSNNMCSLQDSDTLYNIKKCLTIEIPTEDFFPSNICKECFKKITLIIKFCQSVKENEDTLQFFSKYGTLQQYYSKITNNMPITNERKELIIKTVEDDTKTDSEDYDHLITEELSDSRTPQCSSKDEKTLSSVKKEMKIICTSPLKKITFFKPLKVIQFKKKKELENIEYTKPFTCLTCFKELNSQMDLSKHYYTEHIVKHVTSHINDERPLICKLCARTYRTVPEIVRHARAHNGLKLQCPFDCGFTTSYSGAMKEHKNKHLNKYKYTCETCGKGFNTRTGFEQHQNLHTGKKPFVCNICGMAFPLTRYLQTHTSTAHPQTSSLRRYRCIHCDEKCDSAKSLDTHMQGHGIAKKTSLLCEVCGKFLSTAYQLGNHHIMHLGLKPFSCTICKKTFAKKYNVQLHMRIHTGDNYHSCSDCGKRYSQRSTLMRHRKRCHGSGGTS